MDTQIKELRDKGATFREIGEKLGISRQRAHQLCPGKSKQRQTFTAANKLYHHIRLSSADPRGLDFSLTVNDIAEIQTKPCTYGGQGEADGIRIGVDRIDNSSGYVMGNCDPCCYFHNRMRSNIFTKEEMFGIISAYPRLRQCGNATRRKIEQNYREVRETTLHD
jgi:hypothetical protein